MAVAAGPTVCFRVHVADDQDGTDAVLKVLFPDRESEHEELALAYWGGDGAIRLLAANSRHNALLVERCIPGTPLSEAGQGRVLDVLERNGL